MKPGTGQELDSQASVSSADILSVARAVNRIVLRNNSAQTLATSVCRAIVRSPAFSGAWVALFDESASEVTLAQAGFGRSFRSAFCRQGLDTRVESIMHLVGRDTAIEMSHRNEPCASCTLGRKTPSCRSLILRLEHGGEALGVLALDMPTLETLTDEQRSIVEGVATELSLAFHVLREKTKADAQRTEKENLYQTVFQHTGTAVWVVESDGTISLANRMAESLTGYTRAEIENRKRWEEFFTEEDIPKMRRYRRARLRSGQAVQHLQALLVRRSGEIRTVLITPGLVPGTERLIVSMVDVTARKKAEEEIRRLNEYLQGIVDNANVLVILLDRLGRVRVWNRAAELVTGYSAYEVVGQGNFWKRLAPYQVTSQAARGLVDRIYSGEAIDEVEASIITRTGESRPVSWYARRLMDEDGRLLGMVVLGRDMTSHREMEEKKKEAESRAQHAERLAAIGKVAAGVAHEINNPLTGIVGLAELLAREDLTPKAAEYPQAILEGGRRIARIVEGLLTFAGKHEFAGGPVSVNECVRRAMDSQDVNLEQANIHVERHLEPGEPEVSGDATCLQQVFCNLLTNARDELCQLDSQRRLLVRTRLAGNMVVVEFQDNGRGIPHSSLKKIFEPFYTTKEPGKGTGLGLSICHGLVAEHGGRIYARNNAGAGATFTVELPVLHQ
jgi:two-component system NtrC family sensor kinase